jgi:ABC-2 type transport system permease protein
MVYSAFYGGHAAEPPMSLPQLTTYIWLQQAFLAFIALWFRDNELFQLITTGNIAYELCRPSGLYGFWYAKLLAQRLSAATLRCFPILIAAGFLPPAYRLQAPPDLARFLLFLVVLLLGLLVLVAISMLLHISVFITLSPAGSIILFGITGEFFAGMIIPIPLMPEWLQRVAYALPFRLAADFPFRVYNGHIPTEEAAAGIVIQLIWLGALIALGRFLMNRAMRRLVVQGG